MATLVEPKPNNLTPQLQCTTTFFGCALQLKGNFFFKKNFAFTLLLSLSSLRLSQCLPCVHTTFGCGSVLVVSTTKYQNVSCNSGAKSIFFVGYALQLKGKKEKKKNFAFILLLSLSSLPLCVSPNVHYVFTLFLVVVVFWWLALLNIKMYLAIVEPRLYFLAPQLQCTVTFGCAL